MRRLASVVLLACLAPVALAQDTWMSVLLDGRKVGHLQVSRDTHGSRVVTRQALAMRMTRAGHPVPLSTSTTSVETADGQPLEYTVESGLSSRAGTLHRLAAWTQAWIDGRWESFDAALRRFDSSHIALSVGDGDPWRFYASVRVFGNVVISKATPLGGELDAAPVSDAPAPTSGNMR